MKMLRTYMRRNKWVFPWVGVVLIVIVQPACGRSDVSVDCVAYRYTVTPTVEPDKLLAIYHPGGLDEQVFQFVAPAVFVTPATDQAIQDVDNADHVIALSQARLLLSDATIELCRRAIRAQVSSFDFRVDGNNCYATYNPGEIVIEGGIAQSGDLDDPGPPVTLNPVCHAMCLVDECPVDGTGGYDPAPEFPVVRSVACFCEIETIGDCVNADGNLNYSQHLDVGFTESYCVPEGELPANFCRTAIADYYNAGMRMVTYHSTFPNQVMGTCGSFSPATEDLKVTCLPIDATGADILVEAAEAYSDQEDVCEPGCSDLACDDFVVQPDPPDSPCSIGANFELTSACDCDLIPGDCFENGAMPGVCVPELLNGADDGSDSGGGDPRLRSALSLLAGDWASSDDYTCSTLEPDESYVSNANPPPTSGVGPYTLINGTSFTTGLHHTCPAPTTDDVELSTFDMTLEELCRAIPLCNGSSELELAIAAIEGSTMLASGTLEKSGASITTTEAGASLTVGTHTIDLCVEHVPSEVEACSAQSIRAAAPLGSGIDASGHFAGELALDFVELASKPGAVQLSLTDNGYARASLPSGFDFPFYGTTVSTYLYVGANGGINTTNAPIAAANTALPAPTYVDSPDIAVYWDDLDPSSGGGVYAWFDGMRFIVSWENVPHGRDGNSSTSHGVSVQAHIYESGRIELHYLDTDVGDTSYDDGESATMGIGNLAGTQAVEVSHDSDTLLSSGVAAIGIASSSDGCLADGLILPPEVACTARDHYLTVCAPTDEMVTLPLPDVSECASGSVGVEGEVIARGTSESTLVSYSTPIPIDEYGNVEIDEGVFQIRWWPVDAEGDHVGPAFTQLVLARTWVHDDCGGSSQMLLALTEDDDTYVATEPDALALIGRNGEDVLTSAEGDDFIGDGPDAGICEANEGADRLVGEDGDDTLDGGPGADRAWGGSGDDLLVGGSDADELHGQEGHDILQGDAHDDTLWGGRGDDLLEGDDGADTLVPGTGIDAVYGGLGDDTIMILAACELTSGALISGGDGTDQLLLPPGLDLQDVENAGVTVAADIESVGTSTELPIHRAACEPS